MLKNAVNIVARVNTLGILIVFLFYYPTPLIP